MSSNLRRAALLAASGGAYVGSVLVAYHYMKAGREDQAEASKAADGSSSFSYVNDPNRTNKFQQIAYGYDDEIGKDEMVMGINLLRRALLYFHAKGDVLEVGAGTGRNLSYYPGESTVKSIVLTDSSDKMLLRAKSKLLDMPEQKRRRFQVLEADARNLSMCDDNSFDTVVDTFGLCSFDDPVSVLLELQRVCRPGGKILLLEHGTTKKYDGLSNYLDKNAERHAKNWGCVWNRDIEKLVKDSGLEVEKLDTWHFGTTYYVVCKPGQNKSRVPQKNEEVIATSTNFKYFIRERGAQRMSRDQESTHTHEAETRKDI